MDKKRLWSDTYQIMIGLVFFTIPLPHFLVALSSISIILLGLCWLAGLLLGWIRLNMMQLKYIASFTLLFLLPLIPIVAGFGPDVEGLMKYVSKYSSILLLPLFIISYRDRLKMSFILSFFGAGLVVVLAFYVLLLFKYEVYYLTKKLIPNSGTYLSIHLSMMCIYLLHLILKRSFNRSYILILGLVVCVATIYSTPAKAQLFLLPFIFMVLGVYHFRKRKKLLLSLMVAVIVITGGVFTISKPLKKEVSEILYGKWIFVKDGKPQTSISMRSEIWSCSWHLAEENWPHGVGIYPQEELDGCYKSNKFWGWVFHYNTHNQFLGFFLKFGILGAIILILHFALSVKVAVNSRDIIFFCFLVLVIGSMLTENIMERNKGLILFVAFNSLFLQQRISNSKY